MIVATMMVGRPVELPRDEFQRTAVRALGGEWGELADWQAEAYRRGLAQGARADRRLVLTSYHGHEASGRVDARGCRCTLRTCASNRIPQRAYVWSEPSGIRQVLDTGARSNDRRARRKGGVWVDIWYPTARAAREAGVEGWVVVEGAVVGG